jgi:ubiquinone/menaquinone biosynthesis C-methylase UbiE
LRGPLGSQLNDAKRLIEASYSHGSAEYARYAGNLVYSYLSEPLAAAVAPFGGRVLDVAGGTGALTRRLTGAVVVDLSSNQLAQNPAPERVQADAELLPFANDSFSVAASAFGINHFPDAPRAVAEMARVAPVVGLLTWRRPEPRPFLPKVLVLETIARYTGLESTEAGRLVCEMSEAVGSPRAVQTMLEDAELDPKVEIVTTSVPWPGTQRFIDYRLSMEGPGREIKDIEGLKEEAAAAIDALNDEERRWEPELVLGIGRRRV